MTKPNAATAKQIEQSLALIKSIEGIWGKKHARLLPVLKHLGDFYLVAGDYTSAENVYCRYLSISVLEFGDAHPAVAVSLQYVGEAFELQGLFEQAERFYVWSLERINDAEIEKLDVLCQKLVRLYRYDHNHTTTATLEHQLALQCA